MKPKKIKVSDTRYPSLTQAVINQLSGEESGNHAPVENIADSLRDIALHGADGGFTGFTYTEECVQFFKDNRESILHLAEDMAEDMGENLLDMIQGFRCIGKGFSTSDIGKALWGETVCNEADSTIRNGMAWFAAEEIARELNPDL